MALLGTETLWGYLGGLGRALICECPITCPPLLRELSPAIICREKPENAGQGRTEGRPPYNHRAVRGLGCSRN